MYRIIVYEAGRRLKPRRLSPPQYDKRDDLAAVLRSMAAIMAKSPTVAAAVVRVQIDRLA